MDQLKHSISNLFHNAMMCLIDFSLADLTQQLTKTMKSAVLYMCIAAIATSHAHRRMATGSATASITNTEALSSAASAKSSAISEATATLSVDNVDKPVIPASPYAVPALWVDYGMQLEMIAATFGNFTKGTEDFMAEEEDAEGSGDDDEEGESDGENEDDEDGGDEEDGDSNTGVPKSVKSARKRLSHCIAALVALINDYQTAQNSGSTQPSVLKKSMVGLIDLLSSDGTFDLSEASEDQISQYDISTDVLPINDLTAVIKARNMLFRSIQSDMRDNAQEAYKSMMAKYRDTVLNALRSTYKTVLTTDSIDWDLYRKRYIDLVNNAVAVNPHKMGGPVRKYLATWLHSGNADDDAFEKLKANANTPEPQQIGNNTESMLSTDAFKNAFNFKAWKVSSEQISEQTAENSADASVGSLRYLTVGMGALLALLCIGL